MPQPPALRMSGSVAQAVSRAERERGVDRRLRLDGGCRPESDFRSSAQGQVAPSTARCESLSVAVAIALPQTGSRFEKSDLNALFLPNWVMRQALGSQRRTQSVARETKKRNVDIYLITIICCCFDSAFSNRLSPRLTGDLKQGLKD